MKAGDHDPGLSDREPHTYDVVVVGGGGAFAMIEGTFQALMEHGYAGTSTQDRQTRQSKRASLPP
jgi:hypothetical protein